MAREGDDQDDADTTRHEIGSHRGHVLEVLCVSTVLIGLALGFHFFFNSIFLPTELKFTKDVSVEARQSLEIQHLQVELNAVILREVLSGVAAILITFVGYIGWNLTRLSLAQTDILSDVNNLKRRFIDIQTRDNIIVPSGSNYRVISVATLDKLPDPIADVWSRVFKDYRSVPSPPEPRPCSLNGAAILFWPSIDDVINSPDYIKYFSSTINMNFFRVLVTSRPKHDQGLRVYLELARHFSSRIYIVDQDKWYNEIGSTFLRSPHAYKKRKVLHLLRSQIEIVSDTPIASFTASCDKNWLVRYLRSEPSGDPRSRLAQPSSEIVTISSRDHIDDGFRHRIVAAAKFLNAIAAGGVYRDATADGDLDALFATAVPPSLQEVIEGCHAASS